MADAGNEHLEDHPYVARIRERAYMIWEREGRPDGHALAHWVRAKEEVEAEVAAEQVDKTQQSGAS